MRTARFAHGLVVEPKFDEVCDDAHKPPAAHMQVLDYNMKDDALPVGAALRTDPSTAGGDPVFECIHTQARQLYESTAGTLVRRQYEAYASARM